MSRLTAELQRLYQPRPAAEAPAAAGSAPLLLAPDGSVRALVLALAGPADWEVIGRVWRGVQRDLALPAPAIAVSGDEALQLWFSLAEPVPAAQAHAFLAALQARYLADIAPQRVTLWPRADGTRHAACVPALQPASGNWSAFVAQDLAPVFADTPWLDVQPGDDGQAELLAGLVSMKAAEFAAARARFGPTGAPATAPASSASAVPMPADEPRQFLLRVMRDEAAPLALRIEAAKALLPDA